MYYTVVSDNINIMKTTFFFKLQLLTSFLRITSLQVIKVKLFKLTASLCFHIFVYPCCLKAWYKSKFNSKVVFIILILSLTTVCEAPWLLRHIEYFLYPVTSIWQIILIGREKLQILFSPGTCPNFIPFSIRPTSQNHRYIKSRAKDK